MWRRAFQLPLLGSNQDSSDPESDVLPVTPRGNAIRAAGTIRTAGAVPKIPFTAHPINPRPDRVPPIQAPIRRPTRPLVLAALALGTATAGCRGSAVAFGPTPAAAESHASQFFGALAERFTNVERAPKFYRARSKLGRYALTPSKIFDDTTVWSGVGADGSRTLSLEGRFVDGRFLIAPAVSVALPDRLGEQRHLMRLRRLRDGGSEYEWTTSVDHAVGQVRAADMSAVFAATVAAATGRAAEGMRSADVARELRADYRAAFPRTAAALGRLFSVDTVVTTPGTDDAAVLTLRIGLHPDRLQRDFPAFAEYARKYVARSRYRFTLRDPSSGERWLEASAGKNVLTVRLRATRDGRLVPLEGAARPMPDRLALTGEFFTHILLFDVGISDLEAELTPIRAEHERGWLLRFRKEPEWHLPLATRHLIRAPLRRPFQGQGATLRIAVRDGAQTLLGRSSTIVVQESAILRFLGALGFSAMSDFAGKAEAEENRFIAEAFGAMRADAQALLGGLRAGSATR